MLLLICNRELLFIGKRKDEDDMAKSTKTYEERIRALEKKEQESIEATKKLIAQRKELEKRKKAEESKKRTHRLSASVTDNSSISNNVVMPSSCIRGPAIPIN